MATLPKARKKLEAFRAQFSGAANDLTTVRYRQMVELADLLETLLNELDRLVPDHKDVQRLIKD